MRTQVLELPAYLTDMPEWIAKVVIGASVAFIAARILRWIDRMLKRATPLGLLAMVIYGWDAPSDPDDDNGSLSDTEGPPLTFRDVENLQCDGRAWPQYLTVALRWSVMAMFGFMMIGPALVGLPIPTESLSIAALSLFLVADQSAMVNHPSTFPSWGPRLRVGISGLMLIALGGTGVATNQGAADLVWSGLAVIGLCMVIAATANRTSQSIRLLGAGGWLMLTAGVPFLYTGLLSTATGATLTVVTSTANLHTAYRSIRTSRIFAKVK